jgi:hypothetical protein
MRIRDAIPSYLLSSKSLRAFSRSQAALIFSVAEVFLSNPFKLGFIVKVEQVQKRTEAHFLGKGNKPRSIIIAIEKRPQSGL